MILDKCPYCGRKTVEAHAKYKGRCVLCGKRYALYANYRSLQKNQYNSKREAALLDIVEEYRTLHKQGYLAPLSALNEK